MRLQCILCFSIVRIDDDAAGTQVPCPNCGKRIAVPKAPFARGCVIDDFVIESEIGEGGMATVYLAREVSMDRPVALKVLAEHYSTQKRFVERFVKEAKSAARLNHPNIVQSIKVGSDTGLLFYAMEYVKGATLAERIAKDNTLELDQALNIVQQVAEALHTAWTQEGLIHRDVKPDNIMLADDGHAKIMDLGIAVTKQEAVHAEISGTPKFMAPEQFRALPLDGRTDIYSLGATLYNAVCGYAPFNGTSVKEVARKHLAEPLRFPEKSVLFVPQRVKRLISKMMAKDPAKRYQEYDELLQDIVFIRKRLAPDEDMVPSVHTISFSKYRVLEDRGGGSPSEVYRQRSERKRQVAAARAQADVGGEVVAGPRLVTPGHIALVLVLVALIAALAAGMWYVENTRPSAFSRRVATFMAQVVEPAERKTAWEEGRAILRTLPHAASKRERRDSVRLNQRLIRLKSKLLDEREKAMLKQEARLQAINAAVAQKKAELKAAEDRVAARETKIAAAAAAAAAARQAVEAREAALVADAAAAAEMKAAVARRREQIKQRELALNRKLLYAQQLRIMELCRTLKFKQALALVRTGQPDDGPAWNDWRKQKTQEIDDAEDVMRLVADTGDKFAGERLRSGAVMSIDKTGIRLVEAQGELETFKVVPLSSLPAADVLTLAKGVWPDKETWDAAQYHFALCWGDFPAAVTMRPDSIALSQLINGCLQQHVREVAAYLRNGARKLAAAKANRFKTLYGEMPQYKAVEDELVELFRLTGTRTVTTAASKGDTAAASKGDTAAASEDDTATGNATAGAQDGDVKEE